MNTIGRLFILGSLSFTTLQANASPSIADIPEPATMSLLFIGLFGLGLARKRVKSNDRT